MDLLFRKKKKTDIVFAVLLTKQNWEIGEQITGKILFRKDQPVKFSGIRARFIGIESVMMDDKPKEKAVFDTEFVEVSTKGKAAVGDSVFPFQFTIPEGIPPSINVAGLASIKYEVRAQLLIKGHTVMITSELEVFIHQRMPAELPLTHNDKKEWGLIYKESLLLRVIPDKMMYNPGESIELDMTIDNKTKKDVSRILVGVSRSLKRVKHIEETFIVQIEIPRNLLPVDPSAK